MISFNTSLPRALECARRYGAALGMSLQKRLAPKTYHPAVTDHAKLGLTMRASVDTHKPFNGVSVLEKSPEVWKGQPQRAVSPYPTITEQKRIL